MKMAQYTLRTGWSRFDRQKYMTLLRENMDIYRGNFALTGGNKSLQAWNHVLLPMTRESVTVRILILPHTDL
jgi:hypothetical protein